MKLKTMKDLKLNPKEYSDAEYIVKQEAIKWVKFGMKQLTEVDEMDSRHSIRGGIKAFEQFFNIIPEDLK